MRILPRKAFLFEVGLDSFQCAPGLIQDCPDKFRESSMYKLAVADGSLDVISTPSDQRKAENDSNQGKPKNGDKGKTPAGDGSNDKKPGDAE